MQENVLLDIATQSILSKDFEVIDLINIILKNNVNENCDWNIGSILQHFDYNDIIKADYSVFVIFYLRVNSFPSVL